MATTLEAAVAEGAFPGAVVLIAARGEVVYHRAFGCRSLEPERTPMEPGTVFDLSSLTKPLATVTACMLLLREGKLRLDDRVTRFLPNFGLYDKTYITLRHLLAHCSGLAAWRPFHVEIERMERQGRPGFLASAGAREWVYERLQYERCEQPTGTAAVYSDVGFILIGQLVEMLTRMPLDRFCRERIFRPLGLRSMGFVDLELLRLKRITPITEAIAPTERCPWRGKILCGEVHDDNAYAMGGVAGHAGLFADAADVHTLLSRLRACWRGEDDFVPTALVREMWTPAGLVPGSTWALGWDMPATEGSAAGGRMSRHAVGHLGFTGTSMWFDLERDAHVILLTNRVHPTRKNERIRAVRPLVHDAAMEALDG